MTLLEFAKRVEKEQIAGSHQVGLVCDANIENAKTHIHIGKKYDRVDLKSSGYLMVDKAGNIFGIKAYGVIHKGHQYGTLDTIDDYDWSAFYPRKK